MVISPTDCQLKKSTEAGCNWVTSLLAKDGSFARSTRAAFYYKVPAALALNGRFPEAMSCLDWICTHFLDKGGRLFIPPEQEAMRRTNTYDRSWLVWGAQICGRFDLAFPLADDVARYQDPERGGFWDRESERTSGEGIQHAMTAGMAGLAFLATRHLEKACRAGQFLCDLLELQSHSETGLYLALECCDKDHRLLLEQTSADYLDRQGIKQRPARLGPVQVLLVRLYRLFQKPAYLEAARHYTNIVLNGRQGIYDCVESHKFLWGLTELYDVDPVEDYERAAGRIAGYLLEQQQSDGQWWGDAVGGGQGSQQSLELRLNTSCNALVGLAGYRSWKRR